MKRLPRAAAGFTLIELMIVIAVIGILASLGYSTYTQQVAKGRRATARALIQDVLQHEERYYTLNNTYTVTLTDLGYPATLHTNGDTHNITLSVPAGGAIATSVAVKATAIITDAKCDTMTLTSTNAQSGTGSQPSVCWP
jgi:type IV pilus assembly protein PilE